MYCSVVNVSRQAYSTEEPMRKMLAVLTLLLVAGCSGDATAPMDDANVVLLDEMAVLAYSSLQVGEPGEGPHIMGRLAVLPPHLALSGEQIARIGSLVGDFIASTAQDREALAAIRREAFDARQAGGTAEEVRAILATGLAIRVRLHEAERALHRAIMAVLTPAQRAWLANRPPPEPRPCALTEAQRTEISGLRAAYEQVYAADIALVRSVHERARAAHQAGAPREEVAAILAEAREAMQRLRPAREALKLAIHAVLTAEQQAAGCFR
jgi:Spy/CpxP family protein refolding chaperone